MIRFSLLATTLSLVSLARAQGPTVGPTCPVFPANNIWNTRIDQLPVHPSSSTWVSTIGTTLPLHPDFGTVYGIPFVTVPGTQPKYPATFTYQSESDPGPYAVPLNAPIEPGDGHALAVDITNCILYELYLAVPHAASWTAGSGAIFNLQSNALRPATWTSTDAAGLPIFPGLVRYDEILSGHINHAIRFTVPHSQNSYVWPARHEASNLSGNQYPPMGARFRLKASFDISGFSPTNQIILKALKTYGIMLADNGSSWYITGAPDSRWSDDDLHKLTTISGSNFEAVDVTPLMVDPNSGQALQTSVVVSVTPAAASVQIDKTQQFSANVIGNSNQAVTWDVNGTVGGNSAIGFIDSISGLYTAPVAVPSPASVTIHAVSKALASAVGSATLTIVNPPVISVAVSPSTASALPGRTVQFKASVKNSTNQQVSWEVNSIAGGNHTLGTISSTGLYTAPSKVPSPMKVIITAVSAADPSKSASATVNVK